MKSGHYDAKQASGSSSVLAEIGRSTERPPTEAALLRLLLVKCYLLSLYPLDQMFDPVKDWLICDQRRQQTVMLDFTV